MLNCQYNISNPFHLSYLLADLTQLIDVAIQHVRWSLIVGSFAHQKIAKVESSLKQSMWVSRWSRRWIGCPTLFSITVAHIIIVSRLSWRVTRRRRGPDWRNERSSPKTWCPFLDLSHSGSLLLFGSPFFSPGVLLLSGSPFFRSSLRLNSRKYTFLQIVNPLNGSIDMGEASLYKKPRRALCHFQPSPLCNMPPLNRDCRQCWNHLRGNPSLALLNPRTCRLTWVAQKPDEVCWVLKRSAGNVLFNHVRVTNLSNFHFIVVVVLVHISRCLYQVHHSVTKHGTRPSLLHHHLVKLVLNIVDPIWANLLENIS